MSDGKKASMFQRLFGVGDRAGEPAKKDPPQDSPKRDQRPPEAPAKKDPLQIGSPPSKDPPPEPKGPARQIAAQAGKAARSAPGANPEDGAGRRRSPRPWLEPKRSWFDQLRHGLARTSNALSDNLAGALTKRKLDEDTLDRIEEVLIKADLGVAMAGRIRSAIAKGRYERGLDPDAVRDIVASEVASVLEPVASDFALAPGTRPHVFLVVGVNGTGKTTTAAKMAHQFKRKGLSVMLAAADTFRAAAIDQLKVWGDTRGRGSRRQRGRRRPGRSRFRGARTRPRRRRSTCC